MIYLNNGFMTLRGLTRSYGKTNRGPNMVLRFYPPFKGVKRKTIGPAGV